MDPRTTSTPTARAPRRRLRLGLGIGLALLIALAAGTALALRAQLDPGAPVAGVSEVAVRDIEFGPAAVAVPAGTTITWRWQGVEQHNVVGDGFVSPVQTSGEFAHTFAAPGTYAYRCTLHFLMRGEVIVTD